MTQGTRVGEGSSAEHVIILISYKSQEISGIVRGGWKGGTQAHCKETA